MNACFTFFICFSCLFLFDCRAYSQSDVKKLEKGLGLKVSIVNSGDHSVAPVKDFKATYNFGIPFSILFRKHLLIESGVFNYNKNADVQIKISGGFYEVNYDFQFLRIPLVFKYVNNGFYVGGGVGFDFFIDHHSSSEYFNSIDFIYETEPITLAGIINIGMEELLYKNVFAFIEINSSKDLTPLVKNKHRSFRFFEYGFSVGAKYKF